MALHTIFGAGPIGLSLGKQLLCAGHQVRIASRRGTTLEGALTLRLDASDQAEAIKAADGAEVVYNCVNVPYQLWEAELPRLFGSILHAAEHNKSRLVLLDNLYTYYPVNGPLTELSEESPVGPKGKLRLQLAKEHLQAHKTGKVEVAIARASDFYGPQMTNVHLGERVFKPLAQGKTIQWVGNPDCLHSFAFREDVAKALLILGTAENATGLTWIVPHAPAETSRQMIEIAGRILAKTPKIQPISKTLVSILGLVMPLMRELKETMYQFEAPFTVDSSAFENAFGTQPTSIKDGLKASLESYLKMRR